MGYQRVISGLSEGYKKVIRELSVGYQRVIRDLSVGYQRVISGLSEGYQWCRAEAIRVSGAVHESFFEHCLLLGIVVAEATQRLVTTLLPF